MSKIGIEELPPSIVGKITRGVKLTEKEFKKLIRVFAGALLRDFDNPGSIGATYQWTKKIVTRYPLLGDEGKDLGSKTFTMREKIRQRIFYLKRFSKILNRNSETTRLLSSIKIDEEDSDIDRLLEESINETLDSDISI
ncbi:MAG: hypothetical protein MHMPM18_002135, partial [Marteilia pararefringens]